MADGYACEPAYQVGRLIAAKELPDALAHRQDTSVSEIYGRLRPWPRDVLEVLGLHR